MIKRFCDYCETEIPDHEKYYDVMVTVKKEGESEEPNFYDEFCYNCTKSGKALVNLFSQYEEELKKKKK